MDPKTAIAGRPGIAPGFIGGALSVAIGAGFLGGLVTYLASFFVTGDERDPVNAGETGATAARA